jgi:hypothetical protein
MTKTQWTLVVAIIVAAGNAVVPFMSAQVAGVVTVILAALATIFHTSDVNQAVASASASSAAAQKSQY